VPATGVHARLRWKVTTGAHERQVWAEDEFGQDMDGYAAIERREWREDPLMRMAMRSLAWEKYGRRGWRRSRWRGARWSWTTGSEEC